MITKAWEKQIELTNNGELSLFFVGTGTAFTKTDFQTNLLVIKGNTHVLIDCGTLCSYAIVNEYKTPLRNIKNLLITHPHADHIGSLEEFALSGMYITNEKPNIIVNDKLKRKLWYESLRGGLQYSETGLMHFDDYFNQIKPHLIQRLPFEIYECDFGEINLKLFRTRHVTSKPNSLWHSQLSYGIIFDNRILFTGDTQFNKDQFDYLVKKYNIEMIFHDCDVRGYSSGVHATYDQLCTIPREAKKKIFLCHYSKNLTIDEALSDGFAGLTHHGIYYIFN